MALLSVTEGEDKPLKYPTLFNSADAAVITKMDIAEPCGFDRETALKNINEIRPGIRIFETQPRPARAWQEWLGYLTEQRAALKRLTAVAGPEIFPRLLDFRSSVWPILAAREQSASPDAHAGGLISSPIASLALMTPWFLSKQRKTWRRKDT